MIRRTIVLDAAKGLSLDLTAARKWDEVTLRVGRAVLAPMLSRKDLSLGRSVDLPDGSTLLIRVDSPFVWPVLRVERDGVVVPGTDASPDATADFAGKLFAGLGALNFLVGFLQKVPQDRNAAILVGLFFIGTGYLTKRGSRAALVLGTALYVLGAALSFASNQTGAIILQIVVLIPLVRAIKAQSLAQRAPEVRRGFQHAPLPKRTGTSAEKPPLVPPLTFAETVPPKAFAETIAPLAEGKLTPAPVATPAVPPPPPLPTPAPPTPGQTRIGPYVVGGVLGRGGMATVYLARQTSIGRDIALKVITASDSTDPEFGERFRREAETLAHLSHPHILKVFDFGEDAGRPYLAMEHLPGGTLRERIGSDPIPVEQVLKWADQIGQALHAAHVQGVVHRDIKPENVLLDRNGNAFLSDFGLARLADTRANLTRAGMQMGSPSYMSPEQWAGADVDSRADLYSLAVMFFELLTARPPFRAATLPALMTQHVTAPVPSVTNLRAGLSMSLDAFFSKAMNKEPGLRFRDAETMVDAFRRSLKGAPARSGSLPPLSKVAPRVDEPVVPEPRRWGVWASRPVLVIGGLLLAGFLLRGLWPFSSTPEKPRESRRFGSPATTPPAPSTAPAATLPAAEIATIKGRVVRLPWHITDAAFVRNRLVVIDTGNTLHVINPGDGRTRKMAIDSPERLALSPDGLRAAVAAQTSWISLVNLDTLQVERRVLPSAPRPRTMLNGSLALSGDVAYLAPAVWDATERHPDDINLRSIDFLDGQTHLASKALIEPGMRIKLHPSGNSIYMVSPKSSLRFGDLHRVDLPLGSESVVTQLDPFAENACGDFWFSPNGAYVFTKCGNVYSLSEGPNARTKLIGRFPGLRHQIRALAHSPEAREVALIEEGEPGHPESPTDILLTFAIPSLTQVGRDVLPRLGDPQNPVRASGTQVFTTGRKVIVMLDATISSVRGASVQDTAAVFIGDLR